MDKELLKNKRLAVCINQQELAMLKRLSSSQSRTMSEIVRELIWQEYRNYYLNLFNPQPPDLEVDNSGYDLGSDELQLLET